MSGVDRAALIEAAAKALRSSGQLIAGVANVDARTVLDAVLPLVAQALEEAEAIRKDGAARFRGLDMPVAAGAADFQAAGIGFAAYLVRSLAEEGQAK